MQIAFRKIVSQEKQFVIDRDGLKLECVIYRKTNKLCILKGELSGSLLVQCDRSGEEFLKQIKQDLVLYISDGLWDTQSQSELDSFDVVEFFDGFIDIESIFQTEIELIKSDYHIKE